MGQTLSEPSQEKHTASGGDERYVYAVSEMQGWRITMEDAHSTVLELDKKERNAYFAVYDGHGGGSVAKYAGHHIHQRLLSETEYADKDYPGAFKKAFLGTDDDLRADPSFFHDPSGCTAVAALLTSDGKIVCANAGDSRAVLSIKGEVKPLSFDHKPQNKTETARITAAGGYVEFNRVNGNLALSRAIGDFEFKQNYSITAENQIVTSDPDVLVHDITEEDEFVVIACDGIWDCMNNQQVVNYVRHNIASRKPLDQICEDIMSYCLSPDSDVAGGIGCDNMTVMIIGLLHGRTQEQWVDWIAERVEKKIGYDTPSEFPALYPPSRYGRNINNPDSGPATNFLRSGSWANRLMSSQMIYSGTGPLGISSETGFDDDDEFDDDSGDEVMSDATNGDKLHAPPARDENKSLWAQLEELKKRDLEEDSDADGDAVMSEGPFLSHQAPTAIGSPLIPSPVALQDLRSPSPSSRRLQGEAPLPPKPKSKTESEPIVQARAQPDGDAPSGALKVEGFMDSSESPLKM